MSALASHERDPLLSTPTDIPSEDASDEVLPYKRTLAGFLCYSAAAESFSIVSVALFLPICLESFARENGFLAPDHQQNCHSLPTEPHSDRACDVRLLGQWINTSSFSLFAYSISVLSQAIIFVTLGSQANHPNTRKSMLFTSAAVGSISQILFLGLRPSSPIWATVAILSIVGNVAFGLGNVCLNAYLPALARNAPSSSSLDSLEEDDQPQHRQAVAISRASSYISSLGIGTGYTVGIGALLLCLIPVLILHGSIDSMRIAIASSGATWALLSVPAFYLLHSTSTRPQQPVSLTAGWVGMHHMFSEAKQLRQTMQYLLAYIFLSDAFATVMSTATLFAKTVVHMPPQNLILVGVLAPCSGVMGAFMVPMIASSVGATNLQTLLSLCLLASIGPAYGCLALFFNIEPGHIGSLSTHAEIYGFAMLFGFLYGSFQAFSRALYGELIPKGEEARFYSLYAITDKGSSFLGPFLVALIADSTDNLRYGFIVILMGMILPLPLLASLDVQAGREQAAAYGVLAVQDNSADG